MKGWDTRKKTELLDRRPWLRLEEHHVCWPGGQEIPDWLWIELPDFVNVMARTRKGEFLCFRQHKYAMRGEGMGIVGGYVEPGEELRLAARRELREETGYDSDQWQFLGSYAVDGNRGCGHGHLFLATDCVPGEKLPSDDLEELELLHLSLDDVKAALFDGRFGVMPWSTCVALSLLKLDT